MEQRSTGKRIQLVQWCDGFPRAQAEDAMQSEPIRAGSELLKSGGRIRPFSQAVVPPQSWVEQPISGGPLRNIPTLVSCAQRAGKRCIHRRQIVQCSVMLDAAR